MLVEYTGLDAFQGLLGRLNGKSEVDLEKEQKVRDDLKATMYAERKWGGLRFISGGFLAGTREEDPEEAIVSTADTQDSLATSASAIKIGDGEDVSSRMEDDSPPIEVAAKDLPINIVKEIEHGAVIESNPSNAKRKAEKAQRKLDRRERREAKRVKREARQAKQEQRLESQTPTTSPNTEVTHVSKKARITDASPPLTEERPPTQQPKVLQGSQMSLPVGRHAIRHRHIQQKRMAFLHPKALNEVIFASSITIPSILADHFQILMIKA